MVLLFFALDLRTLSPPLLAQVKQCLLELANLYAVSANKVNLKSRSFDYGLENRIGLCYLQCSAASSSDELKIAYSPRGRGFSLRDFHYAVNRLPSDSYSPLFLEDSGSFFFRDVELSRILCDEVLYSTSSKDIEKKIILISSCLVGNMDSKTRTTLLDAADKCLSVEFVFLEQKSSQLSDISEDINKFRGQICDLENCSFNAYLPDGHVFNGLVKKWLRLLKNDTEQMLQAHFVFQGSIAGSFNKISCKLCDSTYQIMDGFCPCEICSCDGIPWDDRENYTFKESLSHHVKKDDLGVGNAEKNSTKVGENTLLTAASWRCWKNLHQVSSAVDFNVIERTSLSSLSDGVVVGRPYIVIPSVGQETDTAPEESDKCQLNNRLFQGLCCALYSMNQGLICWSFCKIEIMRETAFHYYYILQPSDNGPMLLKRLAGAEEIMPFPDVNFSDPSTVEEIDDSVQQCLLEVELRDYNPVEHIGGFHQKFNQLVKESLQSGAVTSECSTTPSDSTCRDGAAAAAVPSQPSSAINDAPPPWKTCPSKPADEDEEGTTRLSQEWERLIVSGIPSADATPMPCEPNSEKSRTLLPPASHRPLDTRTSKILERLGNPKHIKTKNTSPTVVSGRATKADGLTENNLCGGHIDAASADQGSIAIAAACLMKPSFQRLKRKQT